MSDATNKLIAFIDFTHQIRNVKRAMWVRDEEQYENDSEHSFQLAITALYIIESRQLNLDTYKCMALALVHDIIEAYSGDTPVFGAEEFIDSKAEREAKARQQLLTDLPEVPLLHELIDEYESRVTNEAKFIYALDKTVPIINNLLDGGRNWKKDNITLNGHVATKGTKVALDPTVKVYYNEIMEILSTRPELFPKTK